MKKYGKAVNRAVLQFLCVAALIFNVAGQQQNSNASDETALRELKIVLWARAYREQDVNLLDRILHPKFRLIDSDGTISTKPEEIEYIKKNKASYDLFRFEIERLEIFDGRFAVVSGQGIIQSTGKSGKTETRYRSSNHLIKEDGVWRAVSSHVSGVKSTPLKN